MNRYSVNTTVEPTYKPVTLDECKDALEIVDNAHDDKISIMLAAATNEAEHYTGQMFAQRTIEIKYGTVTSLYYLPVSPIRSLTAEYMTDDSYTSFTDFQADLNDRPPLVRFVSLPTVDDHISPIKFTCQVGYTSNNSPATADLIPFDIKQAIIFHVYQSFMTRGELSNEARTTFRNMLHPHRKLGI